MLYKTMSGFLLDESWLSVIFFVLEKVWHYHIYFCYLVIHQTHEGTSSSTHDGRNEWKIQAESELASSWNEGKYIKVPMS